MKEIASQRSEQSQPDAEDDDVTVSELAAYAYCAKAWHLERVLEKSADTDGVRRRQQGSAQHVQHGAQVGRLRQVGVSLTRASILLLVVAVALVLAVVLL